ncbi:MAG: hypothetical protein J7L76_04200 [Spirochaetaceae bacterium]|nr:hypothetical protein [Spirochaetaceae bacterium]
MTIHNAGSIHIDNVLGAFHIAGSGETIPRRILDRFAGGKVLNQSTALARDGASIYHIGWIGKDGIS